MKKVIGLILAGFVVFCGAAWAENDTQKICQEPSAAVVDAGITPAEDAPSLEVDPGLDVMFMAVCSNTCYSIEDELCEIEGSHITCRMTNCAYRQCTCVCGAYFPPCEWDCGLW